MKRYLVGGAVRDQLLQLPVKDRDWVVVGASPQAMLAQGFHQVGKDFPVFLHPTTKEEHALARTERKSGQGYTGFEVYSAPDVTLAQDLIRRDLTINAMAMDDNGTINDPYGGQQDLKQRILRHISCAFSEDPLRVLRTARFAARFSHLDFNICPTTIDLMKAISRSGELGYLPSERVWQELSRALETQSPQVFFKILYQCDALPALLPELLPLCDTASSSPALNILTHSVYFTDNIAIRFATFIHNIIENIHSETALDLSPIEKLCQRLRVPKDITSLTLMMAQHHHTIHQYQTLAHTDIIKLFDQIDAWRKPERLQWLITACHIDAQGRSSQPNIQYQQAHFMRWAFKRASDVNVQTIIAQGIRGADIKPALFSARVHALDGECPTDKN